MTKSFVRSRKRIQIKRYLFSVLAVGCLVVGLIMNIVLVMGQSGATVVGRQEAAGSQEVSQELVMLYAPAAELDAGTRLSAENLRLVPWPRTNVPEGAMRRLEDLDGMFVKTGLPGGLPIVRSGISSSAPSGGIAEFLRAGYRASTIRVDETTGVEAWAQPGSHVDVLVTYYDKGEGEEKSQIEIENAVVLSYNRSTKNDPVSAQLPKIGGNANVTLATPVPDAVRLGLIQSMGKISLLLRSVDDIRSSGKPSVSGGEIRGSGRKPELKRPAAIASFRDKDGVDRRLELRQDEWFEDASGSR